MDSGEENVSMEQKTSSPLIPPQEEQKQEQNQEQDQELQTQQKENVVESSATPRVTPQESVDEQPVSGGSFTPVYRPGCATDPDPLRNLIVNYLPPLMDEAELYHLFSQFGPIESVKIIYDKETKESRGYGFVKYLHFFSATYAINGLNGYHIVGKRLKVAYANVEAAMESYKALRTSAMCFSMEQQMALQAIFYQQILLARQQERQMQQ
ncbi:RNA-binding protein RBP-3 [Trypanosoma theileri]|uniref:RNA-binding protein RBP-3 n=1 Tax=Trypanosoma theileri TaxID=67003 RepID=A0A1X0P599_9TRYP|nr:RNA-binding protein RBP-3 [Trypanosoma theileri]ORC91823.1 RNA-binding protein RBP-3 [Trypanosoma theileri]